jgi:hypothetical protein
MGCCLALAGRGFSENEVDVTISGWGRVGVRLVSTSGFSRVWVVLGGSGVGRDHGSGGSQDRASVRAGRAEGLRLVGLWATDDLHLYTL